LAFIDADLGGRGIEVVGVPCGVEGVGWVFGFVGGDGAVEFVLADVALLVISVKMGEWKKGKEITQGQTVSETMEMLKLVILRAVGRKATMRDTVG
jgi:ABC-type amino acid transport system permease subunit